MHAVLQIKGTWEMLIILKDLKMPKTTFLEIFKIIFKVKMCILLFNANGSQNEIGLHDQFYFYFHTTNDNFDNLLPFK